MERLMVCLNIEEFRLDEQFKFMMEGVGEIIMQNCED
jgi:hypothetical protein